MCVFFFGSMFCNNTKADPARRVAFSARRTNTEVTVAVKAPPSIRSSTWRQARKSASRPLVHGLASALSAGIKSEQLENPGAGVDQGVRTLGPEVDLAGQRPQKSAGAIGPTARPESPLAHARGRAGHNVPPAHIETCPTSYRVSIALPRPDGTQFSSEMITVSARRGGRLAVVADAWHLEHDCSFPFFAFCSCGKLTHGLIYILAGHYEWHVAFPQSDIDVGSIRARLGKDGILAIEVPRRRR